jgi:hypothetical protein
MPKTATPRPISDPAFFAWLKKYPHVRQSNDYDTYGAFKAGLTPDPVTGHLNDEFKLPNHITYSNESKYSKGKNAPPAGRWEGNDKDGWTFHATSTNIKNAGGVEALKEYFKNNEKDSKLVLPPSNTLPENYRAGGRVRMI